MIKSKKQMFIVIGVFALVLMLGTVTYAFFNYTRTGSANTIRTGRIAFNSEQGTAINLTNVFPVDVTNGIPSNSNVGSVTINVTGDTTYGEGLEYLVSAVNVQNTVGNKTLPISIDVSVASNTSNDPATTLGTSDTDYFANRGSSANTSIYKVLAGDVIANNDQLVVGYIKSGATGVDGNIVIRAYLDASKIVISDTYPEQTVHTVKTTGYTSNACEIALTGVTNASTYCSSASSLQSAIDNSNLTSAQITLLVNAGIVEEYTDGTTSGWVGDKTVFTTTEWNDLQQGGVIFQVKVEANEGIWVEEQIQDGTIPSCPGCLFSMVPTNSNKWYASWNTESQEPTILNNPSDYSDNYEDVITNERKSFIGVIINENTNEIDRIFACGLKTNSLTNEEIPFCVEGTSDSSKYSENVSLLQSERLWNGTCQDFQNNYGKVCDSTYVYDVSPVPVSAAVGMCATFKNGEMYCNY